MADPRGYQLFVNVSAADARRRVKGFGHGVRKVRSAGRNQALIIHTATDRHAAELQQLFNDVGWSTRDESLGEPIRNLRNIGEEAAHWLREGQIRTIEELRAIGPAAAYQLVRARVPQATKNLLWALAAGLQDRDWRELSVDEKRSLLDECDAL